LTDSNTNHRDKRSLTTTTSRPYASGTSRPNAGPVLGKTVTGKAEPPFTEELIEVLVQIKPCQNYVFALKIVGAGGTPMAEVTGLKMPALSDLKDFRPPPLSEALRVEPVSNQPQSPPSLIVNPRFGIPAGCVNDLFEAVDLRLMRMENDLNYHIKQREQMLAKERGMQGKLDEHKTSQLKFQFGCKCDKTEVHLNTTDASAIKDYKWRVRVPIRYPPHAM
jgi:hypothetical protein